MKKMNKSYKYLYKYKSLNTISDLNRILDIINKKEIYLPRYDELNDPFESYMMFLTTSDAGSSIINAVGERRSFIDEIFQKYGILSLTSNCRNQVMWAMYANYYNGICIGFENLEDVKKIKYRKTGHMPYISLEESGYKDSIFIKSLFYKYDTWGYEDEYRIVSEEKFMNIKDNIKFIIIGQNVEENIKCILYKECKKNNIKVFKTYINFVDNKILIKNYDFLLKYDGMQIDDDLND